MRTQVGYTGGTKSSPTYRSLGDHTETIDLEYDPKETSYQDLLVSFWNNHEPTSKRSRQYMSAIFYHNDEQMRLAKETMNAHQKTLTRPIVTQILPFEKFYDAEDYHQKYLLRQHPTLLKSLSLSDKALVKSHVASRLNGYVGSYGTVAAFDKELDQLQLNEVQADYVRKQIKSGPLS